MAEPAPALQHTYTLRGVQDALGLGRRAVLALVEAGFVTPARGPRGVYRFAFRDVVLLRTAVELRRAQVPARKIVAALRKLRASLPAGLPLSGLRISAVGGEVAVREGGTRRHAESGQLVLDFDVEPDRRGAAGGIAFLDRRGAADARPAARRQRADVASPADLESQAAAWFARGEMLERSDPAGAEAAYRRALVLAPSQAEAALNLGALLCEQGRCVEAVELYDRAVRARPGEALLHFNRAVALEDLGRPAEALAGYDESLRLAPDLADAHFNAARLHEQLGDAKRAVRHLSAYRRLQKRR